MKIVSAPPKSKQIADIIAMEIRNGNIDPGERLESIRKLAQKFSVSNKVVECAFDSLENEDLITREAGRGTFVKNWKEVIQSDLIGVVSDKKRDNYESYFHDMTSAFSQTGKLCLPIIWNDSEKSSRDSLRKLMKQNPASLIVDIGFYNSLEEIVAISKKTPKCLIGFRSPQEIREYPAVFVDNVAMFTEGIKFLLNRGHKKILILGHNLDLLPTQHAILETVAENLGLEFPSETLLYATHGDFGTDYEERVRDMFNAENPPTAAFGFADYVTWKFTQDLKELYPKHQFQDLIGVHNTEWSRQQGQEFHTFYIPHDKIFAKAIKILNEQADKTTLEWVKPKFIIREK